MRQDNEIKNSQTMGYTNCGYFHCPNYGFSSVCCFALSVTLNFSKDIYTNPFFSPLKACIMTTAQPNTNSKVMNRWIIVIGAIMIQVALGAIYAWSAFTTPLQGTQTLLSEYAFSKTETLAIFSAGLAAFAIMTIVGGRLMKKYKPRTIALAGGIVLGIGYILGGFVGASFIGKLFTIGIIGGSGIGLAYVVPIATGVKWFPDKKGLVSGIAVAGFGFGALIWIILANPPSVLNINGLIVKQTSGPFAYTISNIDTVFMMYGIIFMILVGIGSLVMINPPIGWKPTGWTPSTIDKKTSSKSFSPREMMKSKQYYLLWVIFMVGALAGLMVIGAVQDFAKDPDDGFQAYGYTYQQAVDFAIIGGALCLPILNGAGRIIWGQISDKIGRRKSFIIMFALETLLMGVFFYTVRFEILFYIVAALIGFNFGGLLALMPAATADSFGPETVGINYGYVFTAYGVGGIAGPVLAGFVKDTGMSYLYAFIPAAVLCIIALIIACIYKPAVSDKKA